MTTQICIHQYVTHPKPHDYDLSQIIQQQLDLWHIPTYVRKYTHTSLVIKSYLHKIDINQKQVPPKLIILSFYLPLSVRCPQTSSVENQMSLAENRNLKLFKELLMKYDTTTFVFINMKLRKAHTNISDIYIYIYINTILYLSTHAWVVRT